MSSSIDEGADDMNNPDWKDLPSNVLTQVFSHLTLTELCTCGRVCWCWQSVAGSDCLWSQLLQQQYGCSWPQRSTNSSRSAISPALCPAAQADTVPVPPAGVGGLQQLQSPRQTLLQLRTSKIWAAGCFKADITCVTPTGALLISDTPLGLSMTGTDLSELWSAQHKAAVSSTQPADTNPAASGAATAGSASAATAGSASAAATTHKCSLPSDFAACAVAAGSNYLVLLSSDGRVVDTRGAFLQSVQHCTAQQRDAAIRSLTWLLHIQDQVGQQVAHAAELEQHIDVVLGQLRQGTNISMRNPWLPPSAAPITSIASGEGHVLAVAADGRLWGWGKNDCGQLGLGSCSSQLGLGSCSSWQATPVDITAVMDGAWKANEEAVVSAACGPSHSVVLMANGVVYTAGANSEGQCGQDLGLKQCPLFRQPHMAQVASSNDNSYSSSSSSHPSTSSRQQQQRHHSTSPLDQAADLSGMPGTPAAGNAPAGPDALLPAAATAATAAKALLPAAACIAAGPCNTLVATRAGRVLVCGAAGSGQCGSMWLKAGVCPGFIDVGPEVSWHGLTRPSPQQVEAAGGCVTEALANVVEVAVGDGTCYALTDAGEVFAWGQGSKGQLGTGGCPKVQATPAKLPWARQTRHISASGTGQFAAAVDTAGKLYTWGAGKWGQLGHGDTSKRTVGRLVKQLRHLDALQVHCAAESLMVLTAQHIPHMHQQHQQHKTDTQKQGSSQQAPLAAAPADTPPKQKQKQKGRDKTLSAPTDANTDRSPAGASGVRSKHSRSSKARQQDSTTVASPAKNPGHTDSPGGSLPAHLSALSPAAAAAAGDVSVPGDMSMRGVDWQDVEEEGPFFCPAPKHGSASKHGCSHEDPDHMGGFQRQADSSSSSPSSSRGSKSSSFRRQGSSSSSSSSSSRATDSWQGSSGSPSSPHGRHQRMDKGFKRLLKRLLTGFMADNGQREMTFPSSLSASDRYHVHVAAEEWGLAHASHNQGDERVIKVWKVSRTRKPAAGSPGLGYSSD